MTETISGVALWLRQSKGLACISAASTRMFAQGLLPAARKILFFSTLDF